MKLSVVIIAFAGAIGVLGIACAGQPETGSPAWKTTDVWHHESDVDSAERARLDRLAMAMN